MVPVIFDVLIGLHRRACCLSTGSLDAWLVEQIVGQHGSFRPAYENIPKRQCMACCPKMIFSNVRRALGRTNIRFKCLYDFLWVVRAEDTALTELSAIFSTKLEVVSCSAVANFVAIESFARMTSVSWVIPSTS